MRRTLVVMSFVAVLAACASAGKPGAPAASGNVSSISAQEVAAANLPTAYDLVERLRRPWLRRDPLTGGEVSVYMEERSIGGADALRQIPAVDVESLELVPNEQATLRWGNAVKGSVIVVRRKY